MKTKSSEDLIDRKLIDTLDLLKRVPERDPRLAASTKAKFLMELDVVLPEEKVSRFSYPVQISEFFAWMKEFYYSYSEKKSAFSVLLGLILIFTFMFSGASITARASRSALPGDALYPLKTGMEKARLSLSRDLSHQYELYLLFADNRLQEISLLIEAGRYEDVIALSGEFDYFIQKALEKVNELSAFDPKKAATFTGEIEQRISVYHRSLNDMMLKLPSNYQFNFSGIIPLTGNKIPEQPVGGNNPNTNLNENEKFDGNGNEEFSANENGETSSNNNDNEDGVGNGGYVETEGEEDSNIGIENEGDDSSSGEEEIENHEQGQENELESDVNETPEESESPENY